MEIPVYTINVDDVDCGLTAVSIVSNPAIEKNFVYQSGAKTITLFQADQYKHTIEGPLLIKDQLIIRVDQDSNPYYIRWTEPVIYQCMLKYIKAGYLDNITFQHMPGLLNDVKCLALYMKDGSLYAKYKVDNSDLWNSIVQGKVCGFSIEAAVGYTSE